MVGYTIQNGEKNLKKIRIDFLIEIDENHIDKICRKARCGKRDLEKDIKHMAEVSGRHRVYEFVQAFQTKKEDS